MAAPTVESGVRTTWHVEALIAEDRLGHVYRALTREPTPKAVLLRAWSPGVAEGPGAPTVERALALEAEDPRLHVHEIEGRPVVELDPHGDPLDRSLGWIRRELAPGMHRVEKTDPWGWVGTSRQADPPAAEPHVIYVREPENGGSWHGFALRVLIAGVVFALATWYASSMAPKWAADAPVEGASNLAPSP